MSDSEQFPTQRIAINKGVRQGCPLAPLVFNVYIDRVEDLLNSKQRGVPKDMDRKWLGEFENVSRTFSSKIMTGEEEYDISEGFDSVKDEIFETEIGETSLDGNHWESEDIEHMKGSSTGTRKRRADDMATDESFPMSFQPATSLHGSRGRMAARWTEVRRRSVNWSVEELDGLLNALGRSPHLGLLMSSKHMSTLHEWQTVEDDMRQQGFFRSADQCRLKMKGIRRVFHHLRLGWVPGSKNTAAFPHWFPRMMELWRQAGKPRFNTPLTKGPNSNKNSQPKGTHQTFKTVDVDQETEGHHSLSHRLEAGQSRLQPAHQLHHPGIRPSVWKEHSLKMSPASCQNSGARRTEPLPCRTAASRATSSFQHSTSQEDKKMHNMRSSAYLSQETSLDSRKPTHHTSHIPTPSHRVLPHNPASTRQQVQGPHFPQSHDETTSSPVPRACQASENQSALLKELNTRVQRLEDYHQRTNQLLQQVVAILQSQSNVHQRSVN